MQSSYIVHPINQVCPYPSIFQGRLPRWFFHSARVNLSNKIALLTGKDVVVQTFLRWLGFCLVFLPLSAALDLLWRIFSSTITKHEIRTFQNDPFSKWTFTAFIVKINKIFQMSLLEDLHQNFLLNEMASRKINVTELYVTAICKTTSAVTSVAGRRRFVVSWKNTFCFFVCFKSVPWLVVGVLFLNIHLCVNE